METLLLDAGSGGRASERLINSIFLKYFNNPILARMDDAATLPFTTQNVVMSTDAYTVHPLFFPGGSIGTLAVHGTLNDVAMMGARPIALSCAFILEEGLSMDTLEQVVASMAQAASHAGVPIVTGDTKVVPKGAVDKLFITTTGIGELLAPGPSGHNAKPEDAILVSGTLGDHGITIMAAREGLLHSVNTQSDSASLFPITLALINALGADLHTLRDPTRGGLATTLNEIAGQSSISMEIEEHALPINENVHAASSILGLDPLYLANEGKFICLVPQGRAKEALKIIHSFPEGQNAAIIGRAMPANPRPQVFLRTRMGGQRLLTMLEGAQLPRIC